MAAYSSAAAVASALGLKSKGQRSTLDVIDEISRGLPVESLYRVASHVAPDDADFKYQIVSKATLARRKSRPGAHLTPDESDRLARLAKVWAFARDVWGDDERARAFLFRPHALLEGRRPIDLSLATDLGAHLVEDILGRLRYGTAA
jgi:putative toxin-antitoxin system antitoxin component (TIGR02293 family)